MASLSNQWGLSLFLKDISMPAINPGDTSVGNVSTVHAATVNHDAGVITTESLSTAAGAQYTFTLTNNQITANSIVSVDVWSGTNTTLGLVVNEVTPAAGSCVILIKNSHASSALNGTIVIGFAIVG